MAVNSNSIRLTPGPRRNGVDDARRLAGGGLLVLIVGSVSSYVAATLPFTDRRSIITGGGGESSRSRPG